MEQVNENKLAGIAHQADDLIMKMVMDSDLDPLSVCSVMLARLTLTCDYVGCGDNFRKLMIQAAEYNGKPNETMQ